MRQAIDFKDFRLLDWVLSKREKSYSSSEVSTGVEPFEGYTVLGSENICS